MNWKKVANKILFPSVWIIVFLGILSAIGLAYVFMNRAEEILLAIPVYVISFYTLSVACLYFIFIFPSQYKSIKEKVLKKQFVNRYINDLEYRNKASLFCSLAVNLLYVTVNVIYAFLNHTAWFGILAVYYLILSVMRFLLARYVYKNKLWQDEETELKYTRLCGIILTTLNLVLSGAVLMILYQKKGFEYIGILIYVMAAYTFYITVTAIIDLVKYRKYNNSILSVTKVIKLASALVSMLSLETAMFAQFGTDMSVSSKQLMIALTGAGISIVIIVMSVMLIVGTTNKIKKIRNKI